LISVDGSDRAVYAAIESSAVGCTSDTDLLTLAHEPRGLLAGVSLRSHPHDGITMIGIEH
jgi:hypothetical protein